MRTKNPIIISFLNGHLLTAPKYALALFVIYFKGDLKRLFSYHFLFGFDVQ